ncbi:hypothetical protein TspCOW1_24880 [Thiohalobacter sp. COW1]|uniref:Transcriptional regulator n=1 Tax=Thiohalobacter thiocyanaticus TaxID=585455 RepID=A0A1Z4VM39_9GAMM|nr:MULTISPECIES: MarR family transcriptional regulator [Thiohalobacter]BAZ92657.1 transcriptional regulator [Thiohalobacter thiocyanaticus]BCO32385.1 hypothetical protein TspCOW1_24880 [Thiohalobacter sp. COW1]
MTADPNAAPGSTPEAGQDREIRSIIQQLRIVYRAMQEHSRWVERQCGVSAAQLWALWEMHKRPGMRVSELSRSLSLHQSTTSNMLDKLEKKGLIERRRGGPDQRVVKVYLTAAGAAIVKQAPQPAQGTISDALLRLPEQRLAQLDQGLQAMVAAMVIKDSEAALRHMSDTDDRQEKRFE